MVSLPVISALGTKWWIEIYEELAEDRKEVTYGDLLSVIKNFEEAYSRFLPTSTVSLLNQTGEVQSPTPEFLALLTFGLKMHKETDGTFNFLLGKILENRGYDAEYSFQDKALPEIIPDPNEILKVNDELVTLDITKGQLDLGGFGKGFLIDKLSNYLKNELSLTYFLINGGGDMYGTSDQGRPIKIYLEGEDDQTYLQESSLFNSGFAASSTRKRAWPGQTSEQNHIVQTIKESLNYSSVFVKAPSAALADTWATTLLINHPSNFKSHLEKGGIKVAWYVREEKTLYRNVPDF